MKISYSYYRYLTSLLYLLIRPVVILLESSGLRSLRLFLNRFGVYDFRHTSKSGARIWVHASSVGETGAACAIIAEIKKERPDVSIVLSTVTKTGMQTASRLTGQDVFKIIAPLDFEQVVKKTMNFFSPDVLVLTETELWPNMIMAAKKAEIRIAIVNGRISDSSVKSYKKLKPISSEILSAVNSFSMISDEDASRIMELGADNSRISVSGNSKYDQSLMLKKRADEKANAAMMERLIRKNGRKLLVAGSTRPGEEEIIIGSFCDVKKNIPEFMLLIAPRHPDRTEAVEKILISKKMPYQLRTSLTGSAENTPDVIILNTIGELSSTYRLADVVFCGGSLMPFGGQNPIEASAIGKPVILGRHMDDFRDVADSLIKAGGALEVSNGLELSSAISKILKDSSYAEKSGKKAASCIECMSGAARKHALVILKVLDQK